MKSLFPILGLSFLSLTLTNCSLSPEKIASRIEPSIVKVKNTSGYGTGFFVPGKPEVYTVLTAAYVLNKEKGNNFLETNKDAKTWPLANIEIFHSNIDLALVTFLPKGKKCNYPVLKIGNSERLKKGNLIYISGFPVRGGKLVSQFVKGDVTGLSNLMRGYGVSYQALTVGEMSGSPVVDGRGEVVALHGSTDFEVVQSLASKQASLSEVQRQFYQQALDRVNGGERLTFSWGIPIAFFQESQFYTPDTNISGCGLWILFSSAMIFGGSIVYFGLKRSQSSQVSTQRERELERQLRNEQRRRQDVEGRLSSVTNTHTQEQQELEKQLKNEKRRRQELEAQLQRQGQVQSPVIEPQSSGDVPLVSDVGVDYTKLSELLAAKKWKEADLETGKRMLEAAGRESEGWLDIEHIENFPCQDLGIIDKLWVKYSNGRFGFSVQKQIYQRLGGTKEYKEKVWEAFGDKVGWRQGERWLNYHSLTLDKHFGHLPYVLLCLRVGEDRLGAALLSRSSILVARAVYLDPNI
ncbi:MAG: GUN4 domain-containing protein [Trichodesmium sp. MAG_R04]|nr:GUN4 domain-containing protein [Trichodesmium sp. MAG_R04]